MTEEIVSNLKDINARLRGRGAWLFEHCLDWARVQARANLTRTIAGDFPAFEFVRDSIIKHSVDSAIGPAYRHVLNALLSADVVKNCHGNVVTANAEAERYLRGGWLEEHAGLAARAAGADEVRIGQKVGWVANGFEGVNEIDVIARFGERLVFVSAKGLRAHLDDGDVRHRARLMEALQEADNLVDHFGDSNSVVILLVTTDLWDERRHEPRYEQLHGKAAALGVTLVSLETARWDSLVALFEKLGIET